jgi:chromate reductase, NAD(P)H dehydrogenase (quinone)
MSVRRVAVLVGSLRKDSFTRRVAQALQQLQPASLKLEIVEIRDLALYNSDSEENPPAPWIAFRDSVRACDAVIFLTPEYNRSIPGGLKNAIDVGSRPYGKSVWSGKPCAVASTSPGALGGFGANQHLRQCFVFLDMPILQQPEMYVGGVDKLVEPGGKVTSDATRELFTKFLSAFASWIERTVRAS